MDESLEGNGTHEENVWFETTVLEGVEVQKKVFEQERYGLMVRKS